MSKFTLEVTVFRRKGYGERQELPLPVDTLAQAQHIAKQMRRQLLSSATVPCHVTLLDQQRRPIHID